ncbi:MAG: hypothetical protein DHS80DRAFT_29565 [Piptocephalis tieghemiana]|nr:MAG: hypothetical protein DHS80DRAFT_29565 [Piptocephalis tieghemiana]
MDILQRFPIDITLQILGYLDYDSLAQARKVCRGWEQFINQPSVLLPYLLALEGPIRPRSLLRQSGDSMWKGLSRAVEREQRLDRGTPHSWMTLEDERRDAWWAAHGAPWAAPKPLKFTTTSHYILTDLPGMGIEVWRWVKDVGGGGQGRIRWQGLCSTPFSLGQARTCPEGSRLVVLGNNGNLIIWDLLGSDPKAQEIQGFDGMKTTRKRKRNKERERTKRTSGKLGSKEVSHPFHKVIEIPRNAGQPFEYPMALRGNTLLTLRDKQYLTLWSIQGDKAKSLWSIQGNFDEHTTALLIPSTRQACQRFRGGPVGVEINAPISQVLVQAKPTTFHIYHASTGSVVQILECAQGPPTSFYSPSNLVQSHRELTWYPDHQGQGGEVRVHGGSDAYTLLRESSSDEATWSQSPMETLQSTVWTKVYSGKGTQDRDVAFAAANDQLPGVLAMRRRQVPKVYEDIGPVSHDILPDMDAPWCPMDLAVSHHLYNRHAQPVLQGDHLIIRNVKSQILIFSFNPDRALPTRV